MIKSYKFRRRIANFFIYLLLAILGIIWVSPFVYLVMHSFRAESMTTVPYLIPHEWTFDNYIKLFTSAGSSSINFPRWFINTFVVAIFSCIISTISVLAVSYTFSRLRFGARKKLMNVAMILGMFPGFMTMIAIYYLLKAMGLNQNLIALVATIDGATRNQIFWKIILPMSKPIVVYTVLTSFIGPWCDFILAKIIMGDKRELYTVAIGLQSMVSAEFINEYYKQFLAGSVMVAIPITTLFLIMQRYYVEGVTAGGVKG